ncbi:MAG: SRPBCC family protein [Deltaproteobacteria bacterium]|uniref:SRPBCC family protein n=1 Tax=Candidatus Zymogenus saltonus TaxID=2844893 RepID=A0A9D8KGQ6_9DELT|nr:SRPBCC family protein [Candidatus Zymogenus saltonus]
MKIYNVHERNFSADLEKVGALLNTLAGEDDRLWPRENWPPMELDAPVGEGVRGGHGPIRYFVTEYVPGRRATFDFIDQGLSEGLNGRHLFEVVPRRGSVLLRHIVDADCDLKKWLKWQVFIGPLHDALMEDALDNAEVELSENPKKRSRWSLWVRFLRRMLARRRRTSS